MDQRTLERKALAHATREARHEIIRPALEARRPQRVVHARLTIGDVHQRGEESQVLARRQLGIELQIVPEPAKPSAQRGTAGCRGVSAVVNLARCRRQQSRNNREER